MSVPEIVLSSVTIVLVIVLAAVCIANFRLHRDVDRLSEKIEKFIEKGIKIDFSTKDNHFARLHNSVSDLQSLYLLEKSNTEKETRKNADFISDVSHQLKTPLAAMRLYTEMDIAEAKGEYSVKELQLIDKMENLVLELLKLEKLKSDTYVMHFEPCSLNAVCGETAKTFSTLFPNKTFSVSGDSYLRIDRNWLSEAVGNIVKNASEHTADDGVINVSIEDSDHSATIWIKDNGEGVSPEELPKLFNRFYSANNSHPNSAGIGLAISKTIVEKHHGTISAENTNDGFCIIICLPKIDGYITIE